jgi:phosphoglucomutase
MQAGFSRMNDLTVIQTSQGFAAYIIATSPPSSLPPSIVIGHDHRHNSQRFARLAAAVMIQRGIKVCLPPAT